MNTAPSKDSIVHLVRDSLARHGREGWQIDVLVDGVRQDDGWWYIPVCPDRDVRSSSYYEILSNTEGELQDEKGLDVLLVPAARN